MKSIKCQGCGGLFPDIEGPSHRYMESCPGCWAAFGEVLAREYSDPAYMVVHRLSVDTYAAQHPGRPSRQSIQSVGLHLIRLCLLLEQGTDTSHANEAMLAATKIKHTFKWLEPPTSLGSMTVADVVAATTVETHVQGVKTWANVVWQAWSPHHATIHNWISGQFGMSKRYLAN
ncbi:MAG: DUF5946 family protein [Gammaproteobacteria bacterium]